ncbi:Hypothetical predicted protein [Paramuricea clavata]|uniref:Uncharacterized protein n=1 Tax=Paramuricea clavata TaxID=317549 RepID=A0A6S7G772_PARCT|nr:Hypothetical predicted protein [Paramuricea clavata]
MCENFKRVEKIIFEDKYDYLPGPWSGEKNKLLQEDLLHHILMYILQLDLHKGELLPEDIWCVEDILDDLACLYVLDNLVENVEQDDYEKPEKMKMLYILYVDYIKQHETIDAFYKKNYEFVDEALKE